MGLLVTCLSCANNERIDELPPRELVGADALWRTSHAFDTDLPGWMILVPRRHVTAIHDLTDEEAAALGSWQVRLSRALRAVTGCAKTYVVQFAEQEGFEHVHFHVVPRMPDQPDELRSYRIFGRLGVPPERALSEAGRDALALRLREHLG
ncbi:HIT family protein [Dactylosporangium sp. CA-139066]|uniref:HIT family protein n=1 Tax=Dactylosporangium sp. CA-139066 TaxID=3239930 RepID=UPI003D947E68